MNKLKPFETPYEWLCDNAVFKVSTACSAHEFYAVRIKDCPKEVLSSFPPRELFLIKEEIGGKWLLTASFLNSGDFESLYTDRNPRTVAGALKMWLNDRYEKDFPMWQMLYRIAKGEPEDLEERP